MQKGKEGKEKAIKIQRIKIGKHGNLEGEDALFMMAARMLNFGLRRQWSIR